MLCLVVQPTASLLMTTMSAKVIEERGEAGWGDDEWLRRREGEGKGEEGGIGRLNNKQLK